MSQKSYDGSFSFEILFDPDALLSIFIVEISIASRSWSKSSDLDEVVWYRMTQLGKGVVSENTQINVVSYAPTADIMAVKECHRNISGPGTV